MASKRLLGLNLKANFGDLLVRNWRSFEKKGSSWQSNELKMPTVSSEILKFWFITKTIHIRFKLGIDTFFETRKASFVSCISPS